MKLKPAWYFSTGACLASLSFVLAGAAAVPFTAVSPGRTIALAEIVLQYDSAAKTGVDLKATGILPWYDVSPSATLVRAAMFLQEGVRRMTGTELPIVNRKDLSRGIVLTTLSDADPGMRKDPDILKALRNDGSDIYNDREAFYVRSDRDRVIVIGNTADGVIAGVVELLESTGYEILGMGPDWIYAPDYGKKPLVFDLARAGRPGYYIRALGPTSGQSYGVGTMGSRPRDPADEDVDTSYKRWSIGARIHGASMPGFPGHAMQAYHNAVAVRMKKTGTTAGFLVPKTIIGPDNERPAVSKENEGRIWINSDADGLPGAGKVFISDGKAWQEQSIYEMAAALDFSVPLVRETIIDSMKKYAGEHFAAHPDEVFIFGTDAEDGAGYIDIGKKAFNKNWYPEYIASEKLSFGPYLLNGFKGLYQPAELWDPDSPSDVVFAFNNWLLREYDKWIDSLPPEKRVTSSGKSKKELARCSFYSYGYHDVPPNFNPDPRIRVMIAGYAKNRGWGKWKSIRSHEDAARAFRILLPREPSGDYRIISYAYYEDTTAGIPAEWDTSAEGIAKDLRSTYDAGIKALNFETDFNFGRYGIAYYLMSKMLWNPRMTAVDLNAIRDRWFRRAFGSAAREMKAYYDFMLPGNYPVNSPGAWAKAIRLIDAASRKIDTAREPGARRRIDDVKQFWYYYYLIESGRGTSSSPEMREFAWKGQMSYMVAMHVVTRKFFGKTDVRAAVPEFVESPAHYTGEETRAWWGKVLEYWKTVPVSLFSEATLADGKEAKAADPNDLVMVKEFQGNLKSPCLYYTETPADDAFTYNSGVSKSMRFLTIALKAGDTIGFKMFWPALDDAYYWPRDVYYGVDFWDSSVKKWATLLDKTKNFRHTVEISAAWYSLKLLLVDASMSAPKAGTYRFDLGYGGNLAWLVSPDFDAVNFKYTVPHGMTYFTPADGLTQPPVYFYIPKGTKSLDLEVWDAYKAKTLTLFTGLLSKAEVPSRKVDISNRGTHTIKLNPGEDGTIARIEGNGFAFPILYSVPLLWAKSPAALLLPRAIVNADGLTVMEKTAAD